jgi:AcrR family transcriptional regulator
MMQKTALMSSAIDTAALDPRIRRTRQSLQHALEKLLSEKDFDEISVQDVAGAATLNRATFYDHYPDKFALLECVVATRFRQLLEERNIRFDGCEGAIRKMAIGVCSYLAEMPRAKVASQSGSGQHLETAIVAVMRGMILEGMKSHPGRQRVSPELLASTVAWAIFGAAKEWLRTPNHVSLDRIATTIELMVTPIFSAAEGQPSASKSRRNS